VKRIGEPVSLPVRATAVVLPAAVACAEAIWFGTFWYIILGLGHEPGPDCETLFRWLAAGAIGQWALAIAAAGLMPVALLRPARRHALRPMAWALIPIPLIWLVVTTGLAGSC
jgi:hypothetical protein